MPAFQPIASARLYRIIADQIALKIRGGEFLPGERLPSERELAERLGVSRPSIREALIALEIEGFVDVRVGTGVFVIQARESGSAETLPTAGANDLGPFDVLETRLIVEPECAALTAQHASQHEIDLIEAAHRAMFLSNSPDSHDRAFHGAIAAACGNAALAATMAHIWDLSESSAIYTKLDTHFIDKHVWTTVHREHSRITAAIISRDPIRARHAMRDHIYAMIARIREDFGSGIDP